MSESPSSDTQATESTPLPDNIILYPYAISRDVQIMKDIRDFMDAFDALKPAASIAGNNFMGFLRHEAELNLGFRVREATSIEGHEITEEEFAVMRTLFTRENSPKIYGMRMPDMIWDVRARADAAISFDAIYTLHREDGRGGGVFAVASGKDSVRKYYLLAQWGETQDDLIKEPSQVSRIVSSINAAELKTIANKKRKEHGWFALFFFCLALVCTYLVSYIRDFEMMSVSQAYFAHVVIWGIWLGNSFRPYLWDVFGFSAEAREYRAYVSDNKL